MIKSGTIIFAVYLVFAAYFINQSLGFIKTLPEFITNINQWLTLIGGALIVIGGFYHYKALKKKPA